MDDKEKELVKEEIQNNEVVEKKKSNKWLFIIFCLLFLVACYGVGYFVGVSIAEKENKEDEKTEEKEDVNDKEESDEKDTTTEEVELEKLDVNSTVVKELFEVFREDQDCTYSSLVDELDSSIEAKKYAAYLQLKATDFSVKTCGSLSASHYISENGVEYVCGTNDEADSHLINKDWANFDKAIATEKTDVFSSSVLKSKVQEMFGKNVEYSDGNFFIGEGPIAYYDKTNNLYAKFTCQCGGECGLGEQRLDSIVQDGINLTLETTLTGYENEKTKINYIFEYEKETGNYIFVNREEK